jgi:shikimate dehydrogenase
MNLPEEFDVPTMVFVGVTTGKSFVHRVFPRWLDRMGANGKLFGLDLKLGADSNTYRDTLIALKRTRNCLGALITSHKTGVFEAGQDVFDSVGESAGILREAGVVFWREGKFCCEATDPFSVHEAVKQILTVAGLKRRREVIILGAGGAGLALAYALLRSNEFAPERLILTDISNERIVACEHILAPHARSVVVEVKNAIEVSTDAIVANAARDSLIVNATGMGKDIPGSPVSDRCNFPQRACVWDFNYRGERGFLRTADRQKGSRKLEVVDGWYYFICGWFEAMTRVFDVPKTDILLRQFEMDAKLILSESGA